MATGPSSRGPGSEGRIKSRDYKVEVNVMQ